MELGDRSLLKEFIEEISMKTMELGRKLCIWGLPLALIITILEALTYKHLAFLFCRLLFIVPAIAYLIFIRGSWSKEKTNLI